MLDSTGGKNTKIFRGGQPHLEIVAFRDVSVVESTPIMRFYFVLDRSGNKPIDGGNYLLRKKKRLKL